LGARPPPDDERARRFVGKYLIADYWPEMEFILPKIISWLIVPSNLIVIGLLVGVAGGRFLRPLRAVGAVTIVAVAVIAALPVGKLALHPLEDRFPRPSDLPEPVDGIIVLGGAVRPGLAAAREEASTNEHAERLAAGLMLARRFPEARLVYTGGSGSLAAAAPRETEVARRWYAEAGLPQGRLELEDRSRTTWENAVYTRDLVRPRPDQRWLLVTSAAHMPRAVAAFRAVGWEVIPWPVDYDTGEDIDIYLPVFSENLETIDLAFHEWTGLLFYRLTGRTRELFPLPHG
jgi:uncharacterized SAM-binding protein YcdF (DUF218 family)